MKARKSKKPAGRSVLVSIRSRICDLSFSDEYSERRVLLERLKPTEGDEAAEADRISSELDSLAEVAANGSIEYITDGVIREESGRIEVSYAESDDTGLGGCTTTLHTDSALPGLVTMTRTGPVSGCLTFNSTDRRQLCTYQTEYMPMQFVVYTRSIDNSMSPEGGSITLDYDIEMNGVRTERSRVTFDVTPVNR